MILVDELAHTNAEGSRHAKRWQDIAELLDAGINVYTTLNVQHVESLNDVIAQITGVVVRETLPDTILEEADEIELVDLSPEELIDRLREGKVYVTQQAERALEHFFQKGNLLALRELSLRQVAQRLSRDVQAARQEKAVQGPWPTNERLLVCVGPSPTSAKLIRTAKRMAAAFGAEWIAVAVETTGQNPRDPARQKVAQHLRLAERLGAEIHTLIGENIAQAILDYARSRNVTKIVVGKTALPWLRRLFTGTVVDQLLDRSGDIDIYVIRGAPEKTVPRQPAPPPGPFLWRPYLETTGIVVLCGLAGWLCHYWLRVAETNTAMVFLLGVGIVASRYGRGPAIAASIVNVLVFDFFFVPPVFSFNVSDVQYLLTFAVMLAIGLLISELTARRREQLRASQRQERRTAALYRFTKQLSEIAGVEFLVRTAGQQLREIFAGEVVLYLRDSLGEPAGLRFGADTAIARFAVNSIVAQWVADHDQIAGMGTDTLPNATALFVPLIGSRRNVGALGVRPEDAERFLDPEQQRLLETCASLIALSIERDQSALEAHEAQLRVQAEQLRNSLLSSVSHDLRTPLAAIAGAAASLLQKQQAAESRQQAGEGPASSSPRPGTPGRGAGGEGRELLQSIVDEAHRLARLVDNLLDMTRLESGAVALNKQWHVLEEIIGAARNRLRSELAEHAVHVEIPADLPLLLLDGTLLEQAFSNILENAARYTPAGSRIDITARAVGPQVEIRIADNGPGLPPGTETRIFEKFFRANVSAADGRRGVGLGLTICQAIVLAHGGTIRAHNRPGGGAEFVIELPCGENAPRVRLDEVAALENRPLTTGA